MPRLKCAPPDSGPVRPTRLPYARQAIDEEDIAAVVEVLRSPFLTTGPTVRKFEDALATAVGAEHAVAVSNGTAALHAAMYAARIGSGDEVIVPAMTFAATASAVVFQGGKPVFADVDADTLLLDPDCVVAKITPRTRAVVAVDYAGQPCEYEKLRAIAEPHGLTLVADACHALGGAYRGRPVGSLADLSTFSFHPVKPITTGEGGMVTTDNADWADRMRRFRNHGILADSHEREQSGSWAYEIEDLGFNYRITDIQCALGIRQLAKLPAWVERRQEIAVRYDGAFERLGGVEPLRRRPDVSHAYHLYVIRLDAQAGVPSQAAVFSALRDEGIGVNVHYRPVHLHAYYRRRFGCKPGDCPVAERAYEQMISLPLFPAMHDGDVDDVITAVRKVITADAC